MGSRGRSPRARYGRVLALGRQARERQRAGCDGVPGAQPPSKIRSDVVRIVAVLAVLLAIGACGDDDADDAASRSSTTTATAAPATTSTTVASAEDTEGISELEALAPALLVAGAELPLVGLQDLGYAPPAGPAGCDFVLDDEVPPDLHVGTALGSNGVAFVSEAIRVYPDAATAAEAFDAAVGNEPGCRAAYDELTGPTDVNDRIGADRAVTFTMVDRGGPTEVVYALVGDALVAFVFPPPADPAGPPALDVAAFGVGKILAALEA
jgi:hypothetical protein